MARSMESRSHHYVLEPVFASALLKRNCSKKPLRSRHSPRIDCDIQLETIPLKLSQVCPLFSVASTHCQTGDCGESLDINVSSAGKKVHVRPFPSRLKLC